MTGHVGGRQKSGCAVPNADCLELQANSADTLYYYLIMLPGLPFSFFQLAGALSSVRASLLISKCLILAIQMIYA